MKKFLSLAAALLVFQVPAAFALVGGPWSHDSYGQTQENGVYAFIITFRDGNGFGRFGSNIMDSAFTDGNGFADNGVSVFWFRGITYFGNAFGMVDMPSRTVVGTSSAKSSVGNAIQESGQNRENLTASWHAHIYSRVPQIRFSGNGTIAAFGSLDTAQTVTNFVLPTPTLTGPNGNLILQIITNTRNESGTGGEEPDFPKVGNQKKLRVYGWRSYINTPGN